MYKLSLLHTKLLIKNLTGYLTSIVSKMLIVNLNFWGETGYLKYQWHFGNRNDFRIWINISLLKSDSLDLTKIRCSKLEVFL